MNELKHLAAFERVLNNYEVSDAGKKLLKEVNLVLLVAPTSSGRNTIIRELLKTGHYHYIVSDTTRKSRSNDGVLEQNGVEYWFRSEEDVLADLESGKFLEAAIIHKQQVSGISLAELEVARRQQQVAVTDIEIAGAQSVMRVKPNATAIFVVPPGFAEWQRRISERGQMEKSEHKRRLQSAVDEFQHAMKEPYYHFVVNEDLAKAVRQIDEFVKGSGGNRQKIDDGKRAVEAMYEETRQHLKDM